MTEGQGAETPGERIRASICETIGNTPLVRLTRLPAEVGCAAEILAKLEFFNPLSSVKDRIALAMVEAAERAGKLRPGACIVEPTSGNTGIALAFVCAAKGYRLILTMPESMSLERRKMLKLLGGRARADAGHHGHARGAWPRPSAILAERPGSIMLQQFENPANPAIHRRTTAEEIWRDTGRPARRARGLGRHRRHDHRLRPGAEAAAPAIRIVAVEPEDSAVLSGGKPGPHKIQGIGAGFIPANLDRSLVDEVLPHRQRDRLHDRPPGGGAGGHRRSASPPAPPLAAALEIGARPDMAGRRIVAIVASAAERYLSTELFSEM